MTFSYGDAMLKKDFAEDSLQHELDLSKPLDFTCPIRILHGLDDKVSKIIKDVLEGIINCTSHMQSLK